MNITEIIKDESVLGLLLDTTINGITLSDPNKEDNPIIYANAAFEKITGWSSAETVGKNCRFLQGKDKDQVHVKNIKEAVKERRAIRTDIINYTKDGKLFYNEISISPIYNKSGDLIYFLGIQHDITDKVLAQREIAKSNTQIGALYAMLGVCVVIILAMAAWGLVTAAT